MEMGLFFAQASPFSIGRELLDPESVNLLTPRDNERNA